ncbi:MerR family transcriptional regulator [Sulfitobacter pacificus]|uniref:MerR family transcriptional regulator n=1 Tax=Sulfitobacter pacificus TaxID=1499314 RepID=UPI003103321E
MPKSADAFRTISEVAQWLGIQAHVLRFWESKFTQVRPVKRAGGRRYYRPNDMLLLGGIRQLLHEDGLTIKGVQKILREEGMTHVASLSQPLDELTQSLLEETPASPFVDVPAAAQEETGVVLSFDQKQAQPKEDAPDAPAPTEVSVNIDEKADAQGDAITDPDSAAEVVTEPSQMVEEETAKSTAPEAPPVPASDPDPTARETADSDAPIAAPEPAEADPTPTDIEPVFTGQDVTPSLAAAQPDQTSDAASAEDASPTVDAAPTEPALPETASEAPANTSQEAAQSETVKEPAPQEQTPAVETAAQDVPATAPEETPEPPEPFDPTPVNPNIPIAEPAPIPRPKPDFEKTPLVSDEPENTAPVQATSDADPVESPAPTPVEEPTAVDAPRTEPDQPEGEAAGEDGASANLPAFLRRPMADQPATTLDNPPAETAETNEAAEEIEPPVEETAPAESAPPPAPKPRIIDLPSLTPEHEIAATPAILTAAFRSRQINTAQARKLAPLLEKLTVLRDSMAATRSGATQTGAPTPSND